MTPRLRMYAAVALVCILTLVVAMSARGQASTNTRSLGDQLRLRYDVVALRDGLGLVPRQPKGDIRLIEIRNGGVAINGNTVSALEARERLGQDADLILRATYLDASAQRVRYGKAGDRERGDQSDGREQRSHGQEEPRFGVAPRHEKPDESRGGVQKSEPEGVVSER